MIEGTRRKAGRKMARIDSAHVDSVNCPKRAKAGGKALLNQSGNDDAAETADDHNRPARKPPAKKL